MLTPTAAENSMDAHRQRGCVAMGLHVLHVQRLRGSSMSHADAVIAALFNRAVASLEATAAEVDPCVASVCSNLAGIRAALRRVRAKPHTMDDLRHYQQVRGRLVSASLVTDSI